MHQEGVCVRWCDNPRSALSTNEQTVKLQTNVNTIENEMCHW